MRRSLIVVSALALLISVANAQAQRIAFTKTKVVTISPVDASGHLKAGYRVVQRHAKGHCESGSDSLPGAYRCFTGNLVADPCWPDTATSPASAVCTEAPWSTRLFQIARPAGLKPYAKTTPVAPLGVMLTTGAHCELVGAGVGLFDGNPIRYACGGGTVGLLGQPARTAGLWTIPRVRYDARRQKTVAAGVVKIAVYYQGRSIVWK